MAIHKHHGFNLRTRNNCIHPFRHHPDEMQNISTPLPTVCPWPVSGAFPEFPSLFCPPGRDRWQPRPSVHDAAARTVFHTEFHILACSQKRHRAWPAARRPWMGSLPTLQGYWGVQTLTMRAELTASSPWKLQGTSIRHWLFCGTGCPLDTLSAWSLRPTVTVPLVLVLELYLDRVALSWCLPSSQLIKKRNSYMFPLHKDLMEETNIMCV